MDNDDLPGDADGTQDDKIEQARLWRDKGWTARVIKNDDDEGWAVEMTRDGDPDPALVGPWTMGRDKKNPKPLDANAFGTLVKTAAEVIRRHEQQLHAQLHRDLFVETADARLKIAFDIVPDDEHPFALLTAFDEAGEHIAQVRVRTDFKLTPGSAQAWVDKDFGKP